MLTYAYVNFKRCLHAARKATTLNSGLQQMTPDDWCNLQISHYFPPFCTSLRVAIHHGTAVSESLPDDTVTTHHAQMVGGHRCSDSQLSN